MSSNSSVVGPSKDTEKVVVLDSDEALLAQIGYKQELGRHMGLLQNFGVSFAIISVLTGVLSLFTYGLHTGGPVVMVWGWLVVSSFTLMVGAAMAEICSAHPTAGGPYLWTAKLSKPSYAPFASWICGWFGLLGQMALTTSVSFGCATFIATTCTLRTSFEPNEKHVIGIYSAVVFSQGVLNVYGGRLLDWLNDISVYWNAFGVLLMVIPVLAKAPTHQSAEFVFKQFIDLTGADGVGWSQRAGKAYIAVIGILMSQYTIIGYNASAHMAEETKNAAWIGPLGIVFAIGSSAILGWFLILGLLFSIQDVDATLESGSPVTQIFLDTVGDRGAIALMIIAVGAMYFAGLFSLMSNSRMLYAFARDGGIPGGNFFCRVDKKSKVPIRTVILACLLSFILALPSLGSTVAFAAATSIATIGMYICYGIPIALRVVNGKDFVKGPFHLGIFSYPVAIAAVLWIVFLTVAFVLPQVNPVDKETLNYAVVAVGIVFLYSLGFWVFSARKWFTGQKRQIDADDIGNGGF